MNKKITYRWTKDEDKSKPNNNYSEETEYIIVSEDYDFEDFLYIHSVKCEYEESSNTYYVLDEEGNRTGEAYSIVSIEDTDEDLID